MIVDDVIILEKLLRTEISTEAGLDTRKKKVVIRYSVITLVNPYLNLILEK